MTGLVAGLLCAAVWAVDSVLMKGLSRKLDPITMNAPRTLAGGLTALLLAMATGRIEGYQSVTVEQLLLLIGGIVLAGGIGDSFYILSLGRVGVSTAFTIGSTYPALTLVFGLVFLSERIDAPIAVGLVLVLLGVLLVSKRSTNTETALSTARAPSGIIFALIAAACWGTAPVLTARGIEGLDPIMVTSLRIPALSLILWVVVALRRTSSRLLALSPKEWLILIVGGVVGWGLGSTLYVLAISLAGATRAAILTATGPFFALPLSVVFLKEKANLAVVGGTVLTVIGVILVS